MTKQNHEALKGIYKWMVDKSSDYEDGEMGVHRCMESLCRDTGIPQEVGEWAAEIFMARSAWESGIPLSVINQKTLENAIDLYLPPEDELK